MSESSQAVEAPPAPTRLARFAARFSVIAPLAAVLVYILIGFLAISAGAKFTPVAMIVFGLIGILLILAGFVSGITALVLARGHQRKGVLVKANVGLFLNCLALLLVIVPPLLLPRVLGKGFPTTPQGKYDKATRELTAAATEEKRFYALDSAAKEAFNVSKFEDAKNYANELLKLVPKYQGNWNYGNAIQDGNLVLGRIAVRDGRIEEAKKYLQEAGKSPGSPQMDSFGPNMSLAKDLLEKRERDTVLQYFRLCRGFWKMDYGKLDEWSQEVKVGKIPHFGANLVY